VSSTDFVLFAGPSAPDERLQAAMDAASAALTSPTRRDATKEAVSTFVRAAQQRYAERFNVPELLGIGASRASTADDRVRVFKSLERAVVALAIWDQLGDDDRTALAGPWAELVEAAVEGQ